MRFRPAERDIYSYEAHPRHLAPLGAKPARAALAKAGKQRCDPTELRTKKGLQGYKHLAPLGRSNTKRLFPLTQSPLNQAQDPRWRRLTETILRRSTAHKTCEPDRAVLEIHAQ